MSPRLRRIARAALIVMVPVLAIPSAALAQSDTQVAAAVTPGANLFHTSSPFLMTADTSSGGAIASPRAGKSEGFGIGVKIGPIFNSLSGGNISYSRRSGIEGGIWFGGNRGGRFGVMGEILYAKKSAGLSGDPNVVDIYYLEIPILMRINIGSENKNGLSVYILAGEVNDIRLKASLSGFDVKDQFSALDEGILGGGVEVARFLVEVRETLGLRNVFTSTGLGTGVSTKSKQFAILVGFRFN